MISDGFAQILQADCARFNAKFAEARWRRPKLEPDAWTALLRTTVAPLVEAVNRVAPEQTADAAETLYDLALDLLGQELLGPQCVYPAVMAGWERLLPQLARFVAAAPYQVAGSVTNALYNLSTTPGARPFEWIDALVSLAAVCPDGDMLLRAGQVAAWRAGLAHYRLEALEISTQLANDHVPAARVALGLPADEPALLEEVCDRLLANPWLSPLAAARLTPGAAPQLKLVAQVGDFRGLGGPFLTPPVVVSADGQLMVSEGEGWWCLTADIFGATLHRAPAVDVKPQAAMPRAWKLAWGAGNLPGYPHPQTVTSVAAIETTLAVTSSLSHRIYLLAKVPPDETSPVKPDGR